MGCAAEKLVPSEAACAQQRPRARRHSQLFLPPRRSCAHNAVGLAAAGDALVVKVVVTLLFRDELRLLHLLRDTT